MADARHSSLVLLGAVAPITWGTTYLVTTQLLPPDRPMTAGFIRALGSGAILLAFARQWPGRRAWGRLLVLAALNIGIFFPALFVGAYRLPGGPAAVVTAASTFVAVAFSRLLGLSRTPPAQLAWASVAVAGVALTLGASPLRLDPIGLAAATLAMVSTTLGLVLTRAWGVLPGLSGLGVTGWQLLLGSAMIAPFIAVFDTGTTVVTPAAVAGYAWLAVVCGAIAYAAYFHVARLLPPSSMTLLGPLTPITAALLGWTVLGQALAPAQIAGFALALAASVLGQRLATPSGLPPEPGRRS